MIEFTFHYATGKQLVFDLNEDEAKHLSVCLDAETQWFILADQAINLHQVTLVERS